MLSNAWLLVQRRYTPQTPSLNFIVLDHWPASSSPLVEAVTASSVTMSQLITLCLHHVQGRAGPTLKLSDPN